MFGMLSTQTSLHITGENFVTAVLTRMSAARQFLESVDFRGIWDYSLCGMGGGADG